MLMKDALQRASIALHLWIAASACLTSTTEQLSWIQASPSQQMIWAWEAPLQC